MAEGPKNRQVGRMRRLRAAAMVAAIVAGLVFAMPGTASAAYPQVVPLVNCYYQNTDGSITVVLGYRSTYTSTQRIAVGSRNYASPYRFSSSLPTTFKSGTNNGVATLRIPASELSGASWYLDGTRLNYWSARYNVPVCTQAQLPGFANGAALTVLLLAAGIAGVLVVRRVRRTALRTTPSSNGSTRAAGGDHA